MQVIHMDLKSKNVLLNREQTVAKIADVGLSRGFNCASSEFVAGTREYSAPEVLLGRACTPKVTVKSGSTKICCQGQILAPGVCSPLPLSWHFEVATIANAK